MIMVRQLTKEDIPACRTLWQARFFDSDSFLDWYFSARFCPEMSFGLFDEGKLCSMAHGRRMLLRFGGAAVPALMIGGVSTAVDCEGCGYMRKVLQRMKEFAMEKGFPLLVLATETPAIYKSSGFTVCADSLHAAADGCTPLPLCFEKRGLDLEGLADCCNAAGERYHYFPLRSKDEMQSRIDEMFSDGAGLLVLRGEDGSIEGYAVCQPENGLAEEVLARSDNGYRRLLSALPAGTTAVLPPDLPFDGKRGHGAVMMCLPLDQDRLPKGWNEGVCFCPETF